MAKTGANKRKEDDKHGSSSASKKARRGSARHDESALVGTAEDISSRRLNIIAGIDDTDRVPSTSMLKAHTARQKNAGASANETILQLVEAIMKEQIPSFDEIDDEEARRYCAQPSSKGKEVQQDQEGGIMDCYIGTLKSQKLQKLPIRLGQTLAVLTDDKDQTGSLLNAGGYVYSLDWLRVSGDSTLQYVAVSASLEESPKTIIGERIATGSQIPSSIQVWSINELFVTTLEYVVCCNQGRIAALRWVPTDFSENPALLGVIAACMQDGSTSFLPVPRRDSVGESHTSVRYLRIKPSLSLNVGKAVPITLEWYKDNRLAIGYSDGWLAIWDLASCLRAGSRNARPLSYTRIAFSPISSLVWHPTGREIFVASYDGVTRSVSMATPHMGTIINHSRDVTYALAYCKATQTLVMERPELDEVRSVIFSEGKIQSTTSYSHLGRVRVIATSPHHSLIASGGVDGSVRVADSPLVLQKKKSAANKKKDIVSIIYRLDRHRGNSALRMIDNLADVPQTYQNKHAMAASAAWDSSISLTALQWNLNRNAKGWLASGSACGLVRIDVV